MLPSPARNDGHGAVDDATGNFLKEMRRPPFPMRMSLFEHLLEVALGSASETGPAAPFEASLRAFENALTHVAAPAGNTARAVSKGFAPSYGAGASAPVGARSFYA